MGRVVMFVSGSAYLLRNVKYNTEGRIVSGYVENGGWCLRLEGDRLGAFDSPTKKAMKNAVTSSQINLMEVTVVPVQDWVQGDYNEVIRWADKQGVPYPDEPY